MTSLRAEIDSGGRAYYVVPFIEGDDDEAKSVSATAARLKKGALRGARIGTMHGRMSAAEKDRVMREFRDGAIDVLVCTTVVEVGIDVPEATMIVIVAAERYGLAQLHQLRGRVGRGEGRRDVAWWRRERRTKPRSNASRQCANARPAPRSRRPTCGCEARAICSARDRPERCR